MDIVYIDKWRYEIQEQKVSSDMVYRYMPAHFEHCFFAVSIQGDSGGKVKTLGGDSIGHCE
jgi:hypothetical protein